MINPELVRLIQEETISTIARIADQIATQSDTGGIEQAGTIISVLAENPKYTSVFLSSKLSFVDLYHEFRAEHGCLSFYNTVGGVAEVNTLREDINLEKKSFFKAIPSGQKKKTKFLVENGGEIVGTAHVIKMPDGRFAHIDNFGNVRWVSVSGSFEE